VQGRRENDNAGVWRAGEDRGGRDEAAAVGQVVVHDDDVGGESKACGDAAGHAVGGSDTAQVGFTIEGTGEQFGEDGVVVDDENANLLRRGETGK